MWRTDSLEKTLKLGKIEGGKRRGWQRMRWLDGITDSKDREAWRAAVHGIVKSWTRLSDWTTATVQGEGPHVLRTQGTSPQPHLICARGWRTKFNFLGEVIKQTHTYFSPVKKKTKSEEECSKQSKTRRLKAREWFLEKWNKFQHVWSLEYIGVGGWAVSGQGLGKGEAGKRIECRCWRGYIRRAFVRQGKKCKITLRGG